MSRQPGGGAGGGANRRMPSHSPPRMAMVGAGAAAGARPSRVSPSGGRGSGGSGSGGSGGSGGGGLRKELLKVVCRDTPKGPVEFPLADSKITIGRLQTSDIHLTDPMVSGRHAEILNGFVVDIGSTNGTIVNGNKLVAHSRHLLRLGDKILFGETEVLVQRADARDSDQQELSRSKRFPKGVNADKDGGSGNGGSGSSKDGGKDGGKGNASSPTPPEDEDTRTVDELMDDEFSRIIGHDNLKLQLRQFYKKVQLDRIRAQNGKGDDKQRLYHMIFSGPPGTGKTTMANLVSKLLLKMKLVSSPKVTFVNNSLELLGSYVGQTPAKVDAKVEEARGGVLFIDEAYSIVKGDGGRDGMGNGGQFGREAIDTIMKHMDPPACVFIFAGYEKPMADFLKVNEGLARRIPYRYTFQAYNEEQLLKIFAVMCESKGETLEDGLVDKFPELLRQIPSTQLENQNAGLISNWVAFAQMERDDRLDIEEAERHPELASTLHFDDFMNSLEKIKSMTG